MTKIQPEHNRVAIYGLIIFVVVLGVVFFTLMIYQSRNSYSHYLTGTKLSTITRQQTSYRHSPKLEYDFTYRQGCPHCEHAAPRLVPILRKLHNNDMHLLVVNAKEKCMRNYLSSLGTEETPSMSVRYHGYLLYRYSGTNAKTYKQLARGINPTTHQPLKHYVPATYTVNDGYQNSVLQMPSTSDKQIDLHY